MRRARLLTVVLALAAGCSVLFDPSKIPCDPKTCGTFANATTACANNLCVYTCLKPYADLNGDLGKTGGNGCEQCVAAPGVPAELHALVGRPSGGINWLWDPADGGRPTAYRLCTGDQATTLTTCQTLDASVACASPQGGFACSATVTGLPNNVRRYAALQAIDECGVTSPEGSAPKQSATPINGEFATLADLAFEGTGCDAGLQVDAGAVLFEQRGLCLSALTFGDDRWTDFTLKAQVQVADRMVEFAGGLAFHYPSTLPRSRSSFALIQDTAKSEVNAGFTLLPNGQDFDRTVATSVGPVKSNLWLDVELIVVGGKALASLDQSGNAAPRPLLRWREPLPSGTEPASGRFGIYAVTPLFSSEQLVGFRNLTVSTRAELPDAGPSSLKLDFKTSTPPQAIRRIPSGTNDVKMVNCPVFLAGANCPSDGGCTPEPGSYCLEINQVGLNNGVAAFDQPLGLDPDKPWRLTFKFATTALGTNGQILRSRSGPGTILHGPNAAGWNGKLSSFGLETDAGISPNTWNRVDYHFDKNSYGLDVNGVSYPVPMQFPPSPDWDPHLGALIFGGSDGFNGGNIHGWWTDVEISQPP